MLEAQSGWRGLEKRLDEEGCGSIGKGGTSQHVPKGFLEDHALKGILENKGFLGNKSM